MKTFPSLLRSYRLPAGVFLLTTLLLSFVQLKVERPMLLLERFIPGGGWAEIAVIGLYGGLVAWHMQDPGKSARWRRYTWFAFSVVFFAQLGLGLLGYERFLMSGKLHLPIPMMILAGPVYRGHISMMTILFLSTVLLSGPAWCSHICYFGGLDNLAAGGKAPLRRSIRHKWALKPVILLLVIGAAILLRISGAPLLTATLAAGAFGILGLLIILFLSRRQGRMTHCSAYCPIGTIVHLSRFLNPFRLRIELQSCTQCMACTRHCRYDALQPSDIARGTPGLTCTLCGDCLGACKEGSIQYRFLRLPPVAARRLYLLITISLHAATMALARI